MTPTQSTELTASIYMIVQSSSSTARASVCAAATAITAVAPTSAICLAGASRRPPVRWSARSTAVSRRHLEALPERSGALQRRVQLACRSPVTGRAQVEVTALAAQASSDRLHAGVAVDGARRRRQCVAARAPVLAQRGRLRLWLPAAGTGLPRRASVKAHSRNSQPPRIVGAVLAAPRSNHATTTRYPGCVMGDGWSSRILHVDTVALASKEVLLVRALLFPR